MSDIEVVERWYEALGARDLAAIAELLHPEAVVTQDERLPWGGRWVGHDGFLQFGAALTGSIASAVTIDAIFEADGDIVEIGRTRGTVVANGQAFDIPEVHRFTVRDGQIVAAHFAIDTPGMLAALHA